MQSLLMRIDRQKKSPVKICILKRDVKKGSDLNDITEPFASIKCKRCRGPIGRGVEGGGGRPSAVVLI